MNRILGFALFLCIVSFIVGLWKQSGSLLKDFRKDVFAPKEILLISPKGYFKPSLQTDFQVSSGIRLRMLEFKSDSEFIDILIKQKNFLGIIVAQNHQTRFVEESEKLTPIVEIDKDCCEVSPDFQDLVKSRARWWIPWSWEALGLIVEKNLATDPEATTKEVLDVILDSKKKLYFRLSEYEFLFALLQTGTINREWVQEEKMDSIGPAVLELKQKVGRSDLTPIKMQVPFGGAFAGHGVAKESIRNDEFKFLLPVKSPLIVYEMAFVTKGTGLAPVREFLRFILDESRIIESSVFRQQASTLVEAETKSLPDYLRPSYLRNLPLSHLSSETDPMLFQRSMATEINRQLPPEIHQ